MSKKEHAKLKRKNGQSTRYPKSSPVLDCSPLLSYSKYCDGLPLYRLNNIIKRYGDEISRTSMVHWVIKLALQLQPLINLMREHQLPYDYLQVDEARIKVLKESD
ncbi:MAG: transposase [Endozoicomonadaceae bacterium]|nr:transposase [Endozoicomonadaceae bacterium]